MNNLPHIRYLHSEPAFPATPSLPYPHMQRDLAAAVRRTGSPDTSSIADDRMAALRDTASRLPV